MTYEAKRLKVIETLKRKGATFKLVTTNENGQVQRLDLRAIRVGVSKRLDDQGLRIGDYEYLAENNLVAVPKKGNRLELGDESWVIREIDELRPTDTVVFYSLFVDHG